MSYNQIVSKNVFKKLIDIIVRSRPQTVGPTSETHTSQLYSEYVPLKMSYNRKTSKPWFKNEVKNAIGAKIKPIKDGKDIT